MIELEVPIRFVMAVEAGNFAALEDLLADEMRFCGPVSRPLDKKQFIQIMRAMRTGIPNWKSHFRDVNFRGNITSMTIEVTGAHLHTMPPMPCLPPLLSGTTAYPPTGKTFHLPAEHVEFALDRGKIIRIHLDPVPGGWVIGILEQLGILVTEMN